MLVLDDAGLHYRMLREVFVIPWATVIGVDVEGPDLPQQRVTMTRLATMGPFAWAAKKTTSDVYLQVRTDRFAVGFQIPKTSAGAMHATLGGWTAHLRADRPIEPVPTVPPPAPQAPPAGWYNDPEGHAAQRWWDGTTWTEHTQ